LKEFELYERYSSLHPSCHHLRIEQVEVEGMDMSEVEDIDMIKEQDHPTNHQLGEEGMDMVGTNMVEVDGMYTVEEHFYLMNNRSDVEGMDTVEKHFYPMNHRPEVESMNTLEEHFHLMNHLPEVKAMDTVDTDMGEDRAAELEVIEREPVGMVLARHWTGDGAMRHRQTRREWEELVKPVYSKDQPTFATHDSNYSSS
jgi:hypothetical protein